MNRDIVLEDNSQIAAGTDSQGRGGDILIKSNGNLTLNNNSAISSATGAEGDAGNVFIDVKGNINLSKGFIFANSQPLDTTKKNASGNAGDVNLKAEGDVILNDRSSIAALTVGKGQGGEINVNAGHNIFVGENSMIGAISSQNLAQSSGNAGNITVTAANEIKFSRGFITSYTNTSGHAGNVNVYADTIKIENQGSISSGSHETNSGGQIGQVKVIANSKLSLDHGSIHSANQANLTESALKAITPGSITITAPDIDLKSSVITTESMGNIAAGDININFTHWLTQDSDSKIETTAASGNGGAITITGGQLLSQQNSSIRTSVAGGQGNGGPITVNADVLLMDTGLIQANANSGNGGDINLNIKAIIPSGDSLIVGGARVDWNALTPTFNVIQAVSETGVSGAPNITAPQLNLSGVLSNLGSALLNSSMLSPEYCHLGAGSTLTRKGRGGLKPKRDDVLF